MERRGDSAEFSDNSQQVNSRQSSNTRKYKDDRDDRHKHHSSSRRNSKNSRSPPVRSRKRRTRSRSVSRERRSSSDRRRHHRRSRTRSRSPGKKSHDRKAHDDKYDSCYRSKRDKRSRSRSSERAERNRERNKIEMRQLMAKNYEEQIEKMKGNSTLGQKPYNSVDPSKLVEQVERRKLLWSKKEKSAEPSSSTSVWNQTKFSDDSDGKVTAKFKRLMGMKGEGESATEDVDKSETVIRKQEEYFADLEKQYEVARATTHTQRGVGLGFSSRSFPVKPKP